MRHARMVASVLVMSLVLATGHIAVAQGPIVTITPTGATNTWAAGISGSQIVGYYDSSVPPVPPKFHGFLTSASGGSPSTIDVSGALDTWATGINASGVIVGHYVDGTGVHGFSLAGGVATPINVSGARSTVVTGVNDSGEVVGNYVDSSGRTHGFSLISGGTPITIDVNGAALTEATGVNNSGVVVGDYLDAMGYHGFSRTAGGFVTPINVPTGPSTFAASTFAVGINTNGLIAGYYFDSMFKLHGFVLNNGIFTTEDVSGAADTAVNGINNRDQTVGFYENAAMTPFGFFNKRHTR